MEKQIRSSRVDLEVEITFESEHNFYTGFTQNISGGGLFVSTPMPRPIGAVMVVRFRLATADDTIDIETEAIVRWVREIGVTGMGVQFLHLADEHRKAIDHFIAQRESIFYDD